MILYVKENQVYANFFQNFLKIALSICKNNFNCLNCFHLVFFLKKPYLQVDNNLCLLKGNWKCQRQLTETCGSI